MEAGKAAASEHWRGRIRALLYPVQFADDPVSAVDHVLKVVVAAGALNSTPQQYLDAVRRGLAGEEKLSELLPQDHSEETIRRFLAEVERRLAVEAPATPASK